MIRISVMVIENKGQMSEAESAIVCLTKGGLDLAMRLNSSMPKAVIYYYSVNLESKTWNQPSIEPFSSLPELIRRIWHKYHALIFIMATGIVVRTIAPFIKDKKTDPAVLVVDERGQFVISLLSGHIGGANELAEKIADYLGAQPVITTASDVKGRLSLDIWATEKGLHIEDWERLKRLSARIVNGEKVMIWSDVAVENPPEEFIFADFINAEIAITNKMIQKDGLFLRPKNIVLGIGCNRGVSISKIEEAVASSLNTHSLSFNSVRNLATIDIKKDEVGLLKFADSKNLPIDFFPKDELNQTALAHNIKGSRTVLKAIGAMAVAESAAILSAQKAFGDNFLLMPKKKWGGVTLAIALGKFTL